MRKGRRSVSWKVGFVGGERRREDEEGGKGREAQAVGKR